MFKTSMSSKCFRFNALSFITRTLPVFTTIINSVIPPLLSESCRRQSPTSSLLSPLLLFSDRSRRRLVHLTESSISQRRNVSALLYQSMTHYMLPMCDCMTAISIIGLMTCVLVGRACHYLSALTTGNSIFPRCFTFTYTLMTYLQIEIM